MKKLIFFLMFLLMVSFAYGYTYNANPYQQSDIGFKRTGDKLNISFKDDYIIIQALFYYQGDTYTFQEASQWGADYEISGSKNNGNWKIGGTIDASNVPQTIKNNGFRIYFQVIEQTNGVDLQVFNKRLYLNKYLYIDWRDLQFPTNKFTIFNKSVIYSNLWHDTVSYDPTITIEDINTYGGQRINTSFRIAPTTQALVTNPVIKQYLNFDVNRSNFANDLSENENHMFQWNGIGQRKNKGKYGAGFQMNSSEQNYLLMSGATVNSSQPFAFSMWVNATSVDVNAFLYYSYSATRYVTVFRGSSGQVRFRTYNNSNIVECDTGNNQFLADGYHHWLFSWNGTHKVIYKDGTDIKNCAFVDMVGVSDDALSRNVYGSGLATGTWQLDANVDEIMAIQGVLNAQDVTNIYNMNYERFSLNSITTIVTNVSTYGESQINVTLNSFQPVSSSVNVSASIWNGSYINHPNLLVAYGLNNQSSFGENNTHVFDHSQNGNNGTVTDAKVNDTGYYDDSFSFDGDGDYIDMGNWEPLKLINSSFTISLWSRPYDVDNTDRILDFGPDGDGYSLRQNTGGTGDLRFYMNGGTCNDLLSNSYSIVGKWYHILITHEASTGLTTFYLDNQQKDSDTCQNITSASGNLYLGGRYQNPLANGFTGNIDELFIFNRTLSESERNNLYEGSMLKFVDETDDQILPSGLNQKLMFNFTNNESLLMSVNFKFNDLYYPSSVYKEEIITTGKAEVIGGPDTDAPTFSNLANNGSTISGGTINWSVDISDVTEVDWYRFAHNDSGSWTNQTIQDGSSTSVFYDYVEEIDQSAGSYVCGQFWANDTGGYAGVSDLSCFTVDGVAPTTCWSVNNNKLSFPLSTCRVPLTAVTGYINITKS